MVRGRRHFKREKCTATGEGDCRRNRGITPENGGKSPAKPKEGRPRTEFTAAPNVSSVLPSLYSSAHFCNLFYQLFHLSLT